MLARGAWRRSERVAIYNPEPFLTVDDRRLLSLLGQLVLQSEGVKLPSNKAADAIELSDREAAELLDLLEKFVESRRAVETSYLLEEMFSGRAFDSRNLRDIYLSWRRFHGKSRALATDQWEMLLSRMGVPTRLYGDTPWYRNDAQPMDLDYFLKMERRLAASTGISPRVQYLIVAYVRLQFPYIEQVREGILLLDKGQILRKPKQIIDQIRQGLFSRVGTKPVTTTKLAATMTIVMDSAVLYTTRDWSVAGFFSTIAGAAPLAILD
jgi:hypothetical protein